MGIVDCVRYSMATGSPELVVGAHIDPGLFVLALPQTGLGLQLRDEHGTWVDVPKGKGVIWAGSAGVGRYVKGGEHRVVSHASCRMAMWHEMCTYGQLVPPMLRLLNEKGLELRMGETRGTPDVMRKLRADEDHQPAAETCPKRQRDTQMQFETVWTTHGFVTKFTQTGVTEKAAVGQGSLVIKGVPSPKTGTFGWHRLIGPHAVGRTSGSWESGGGFGGLFQSQVPPGAVEVVPRDGYLREPGMLFASSTAKHYGTRKYLRPENMMEC